MFFKKAIDDATSEWAQHHAKRYIDTKAKVGVRCICLVPEGPCCCGAGRAQACMCLLPCSCQSLFAALLTVLRRYCHLCCALNICRAVSSFAGPARLHTTQLPLPACGVWHHRWQVTLLCGVLLVCMLALVAPRLPPPPAATSPGLGAALSNSDLCRVSRTCAGFVHVIDDETNFDKGLARSVMIGEYTFQICRPTCLNTVWLQWLFVNQHQNLPLSCCSAATAVKGSTGCV